eukprot:scaffold300844_cov33-Tisochrysis_lutea.AAC.1
MAEFKATLMHVLEAICPGGFETACADRMHPYHVGVKCRARRSEVLGPTCSDPPAKWVWVPAKWVWAQGDSALHAAATAHEGYPQGVEGCIRGVPKGERVQASRECHVAL